MRGLPLENPSPDFESLERVIRGEEKAKRVHFLELDIDEEIMKYVFKSYMNGEWIPEKEGREEEYQKQRIYFYYRMGYDCLAVWHQFENLPQFRYEKTADTAGLSRGERSWIQQRGGLINNWDDFKRIDWNGIRPNLERLDYAQKYLPKGMKIVPAAPLFEMILQKFLGYENLFVLYHDNPKLIEAVFEKWGQKVYDYYEKALQYPEVGAIIQIDDLGHKTGTLMSPGFLRKNVFPWFKKYAVLAHQHEKMFWYHSCGNVLEIMDDLIEDVGIDAFHSFQDTIIPVGDFMKRYGDKIGILGGVDMDKFARMNESELRDYVREILNEYAPGRYALGSGNSAANYIPIRNYFAMLDEGFNWQG